MSSTPFVLAASAEMLYVDRPVADRVRAIHDAGFAVEIWDWRNHDLDELEALAASGVVFTSMTGYTTGTLADEAAPTSCCAPPPSPSWSRADWARRA